MTFSTTQFVVLAGGLGTRLQSVVSSIPKPMADISNRPFLEYLLDQLIDDGVSEVTLATGHLTDKIEKHFGKEWKSLRINYSVDMRPLGTGGALLNALDSSYDSVVTINGDTFQDISYKSLTESLTKKDDGVLAVRNVEDVSDFGSLVISAEGTVTKFGEKTSTGSGFIYSGVSFLKTSKLLDWVHSFQTSGPQISLEKDVLPGVIARGAVRTFPVQGFFVDIGTPARLEVARSNMRS